MHGRRDPEPRREERFVRLGRVDPVDAARADDRDPQSARPEPCRIPETRTSSATTTAANRPGSTNGSPARRHDPEPGQGHRPVPAPGDAARPARSGRAGPRRRCGPRRRGRSTRRPARPGPAPRRRPPRARGDGRGRVVVRPPQGGAVPQLGQGERPAGFTPGRDASAASSRKAAPPGSTRAAPRSPCREITPCAHALTPRLDATRSAPSRAAFCTDASRVRAAPAEKAERSATAIDSPRPDVHGAAGRLVVLGGRASSHITRPLSGTAQVAAKYALSADTGS